MWFVSNMSALALSLLDLSSSYTGLMGNSGPSQQDVLAAQREAASAVNGIAYSTRVYWMREANAALLAVTKTSCPFQAFGSVVVDHAADPQGLGKLVCIGANANRQTGNPTLHGEIAAINNCTDVLTDPEGPYRLTPEELPAAFATLSLYTNAESCPMCASAIRWAGFREYVYGTTIDKLIAQGWPQIRISSAEVFRKSGRLSSTTALLGSVLTNETDRYFAWQFDTKTACPPGCGRVKGYCNSL